MIVSEWMGYALLFESMLDSVLYARDRCPCLSIPPRLAGHWRLQGMPCKGRMRCAVHGTQVSCKQWYVLNVKGGQRQAMCAGG